MSSKYSVLVTLSCFLYLSSAATAFNITRLLGRFPQFGTFNSLLNQTGLAQEINSRATITVLAVDNGTVASLAAMPMDVVKRVLQTHVILDYYDMTKLQQLSHKSSIVVTTLYQASGIADMQQGFLNISHLPGNQIGFASAIKGSVPYVHLVQLVASQPYNISVLQVSGVIVTPGIDASLTPPISSPPPAPAPATKNSTATPVPAPAPSPDDDDDNSADAPTAPDASPPAETPADTPADAPVVSPPADAPSADDDASDKTASPPKSSAMRFTSSFFVVALLSSLAAF